MIPKYERIKQDIIKELQDGMFLPGDKIYSEDDLKTKYQVSSTTVVKALNDMVMDGYLIRRQGKGTFVRRNLFNRPVYISEQTLVNSNSKTSNEERLTFTFDNIKYSDVNKLLGDGDLLKVTHISLIDDIAWNVQVRYVLSDHLSKNSKKKIQQGSSLSGELGYAGNLINYPAEMNISSEIFNSEHELIHDLDDDIKDRVGHEDRATIKITRIIKNLDNEPIEYDIRYINPEYYKLSINSNIQ